MDTNCRRRKSKKKLNQRTALLIFLNRNRAGFYFHLKGLLEGRPPAPTTGPAEGHSRKVCDDDESLTVTVCVDSLWTLWSEQQTRRAGHDGWVGLSVGEEEWSNGKIQGLF